MGEFLALRCYACGMYQVKPRTKSSKWCCSICHEKQSVTKVYGVGGAAKKIRELVQSLNFSSLSKQEEQGNEALEEIVDEEEERDFGSGEIPAKNVGGAADANKWAEYLETEDLRCEAHADDDDPQFVTCIPDVAAKRKRCDDPARNRSTKNPSFPTLERRSSKALVSSNRQRSLDCSTNPSSSEVVPDLSTDVSPDVRQDRRSWSLKADAMKKIEAATDSEFGFRSSAQTATSSKWSKYLETSSNKHDKLQSSSRKWIPPQQVSFREDEFQTELADELVSEDIHPSFESNTATQSDDTELDRVDVEVQYPGLHQPSVR